jgi:hypothetical protein
MSALSGDEHDYDDPDPRSRVRGQSPVQAANPTSDFDAEKAAYNLQLNATARTGDALWTNLSTYSGKGGKLIFYHGPAVCLSSSRTVQRHRRSTRAASFSCRQ